MMTKLVGAKERLNFMFDRGVVLPRNDLYEAGLGCNIYFGKSERLFRYKQWQLNYLGVIRITSEEAVEHLAGDPPNNETADEKTSYYEHVYNHLLDCEETSIWGSKSKIYELKKNKWRGFWWKKELEWSIRHAKLNELETPPPPEMMLRVIQSRMVKMFNAYSVVLFGERILLIGQVWELPPTFCGPNVKFMTTGNVAYYYLGDWSLT